MIKVKDETYFTGPEVAKMIGISRMTIFRWASKAMTPNGERLRVLKDRLFNRYYIAESSVNMLVEKYGSLESRLEVV